jgi:hypothetical protein
MVFEDLFIANTGKNTLYHNNGNGTFTDVTDGSGLDKKPPDTLSVQAAWFDYDNDGFLDLYVVNNNANISAITANFLYRNNGNSNAWLVVKLTGRVSNRFGVGAKVRLLAHYRGNDWWQLREITNGDGYDDVVIGAYGADPHGSESGETYVVYGGSALGSAIELSSLDGSDGVCKSGDVALRQSSQCTIDDCSVKRVSCTCGIYNLHPEPGIIPGF